MKRHIVIGWFLLLALSACRHSVETQNFASLQSVPSMELQSIDSLMWQQPDSALALLLPWFDTCRDAMLASPTDPAGDTTSETHAMRLYNRHYAHLLLSELLYKNDYAQANREALLDAVAYFDSLVLAADTRSVSLQRPTRRDARRASAIGATTAFLDARAHYINGVGYYEQDSVVEACKEYLKALEIMESHFNEQELVGEKARFVALAYTRLTDLFADFYLHEQAIDFSGQALDYYIQNSTSSRQIARMFEEIGSHYDMMGQLDSAYCYYNKGIDLLSDTSCLTYRDLATHLAFLSYNMGGLSLTSLNQLQVVLRQAESQTEALSRCAIIGEIYYHESQYDSAIFYLGKVFQSTNSEDLKRQDAKLLVEILKTQGRDSDILEYAEYLAPFATQDEDKSAIKSHLMKLGNEYKQHVLENRHKQNVKKQTKLFAFLFTGLLMVILGVFVLYWKNRRKKQSLETQIKKNQYAYEMKQKALAGRLKTSNDALRDTLKRLERSEAERNKDFKGFEKEIYDAFKKKPICHELLETEKKLHSSNRNSIKTSTNVADYKDLAMSLSQKAILIKTVEMAFPHLYDRLTTLYPSLDRNEWLHCCLYLLQLDKMSVCILLQEPYYTCRRCTLKLEKMFDCKRGLPAFLMEQSLA